MTLRQFFAGAPARLLVVLSLFITTGCAQQSGNFEFWGHKQSAPILQSKKAQTLTVTDRYGNPLADAQVLIGHAVDVPFQNNFLTTDLNGEFVVPQDWKGALPVTIEADGYVRATFLDQTPTIRNFELNESQGRDSLELKGEATGMGALKKDGFIDFAIVFPMFKRGSFIHFNISDLLSPEVDEVSIFGQKLPMPSNFSVPSQKENYGILSLTISKPIYRTYVTKPDSYRFLAARGKFPFEPVAKDLRNGKTYFDVMNQVTFMSAGVEDFKIQLTTQNQNIDVNKHVFVNDLEVQAPAYTKGLSMIGVTLNKDPDGLYLPSDVKTFASSEKHKLNTSPNMDHYVFSVLGTQRQLKSRLVTFEEQMSTSLVGATVGTLLQPRHLPLINKPDFDGVKITAAAPQNTTGFSRTGAYFVLSDVDIQDLPKSYHEQKTRLWEIYSATWTEEVELPVWPDPAGLSSVKRWEAAYLAVGFTQPQVVETGPQMIDSSTHVTKNALDF